MRKLVLRVHNPFLPKEFIALMLQIAKSLTPIKTALDFMKILEFSRSYKTITIRFLGGGKYMLLFYFTS